MIRNILLIIVSVIVTLVILEGVLRLAGAVFLWKQEHSHPAVTLHEGEYRILCIGESTTALGGDFSYPQQLQDILNNVHGPYHFVVINKGVPSIDTDVIVQSLPGYLEQYHPQMVVAMMGINDHAFYAPGGWNNLKVIKLFRMIFVHSQKKFAEQKTFENPMVMSKDLETKGEYPKAIEVVNKYLNSLPEKEVVPRILGLWELAQCYKSQGELTKAIKYYQAVLSLAPNHNRAWGDLGDTYLLMGRLDQAYTCLLKQLSIEPRETWFYSKMVSCLEQLKRMNEIEPMLQYGLRFNPNSTDILIDLGHFYIDQGRLKEASGVLEHVLEITSQDSSAFNSDVISSLKGIYQKTGEIDKMIKLSRAHVGIGAKTQLNFQEVKDMTRRKGIELVVMQYPMRSLSALKESVGAASHILFVDNERIFKDAVSKENYADYFIDRFGGDFGHATPKGNHLLASNLATLILNYLSVTR
jgi:tetratricopeptide (TPR) repeat protein